MKRTLRARVFGSIGAVALVGGVVAGLTVGTAAASSPSDARATFHSGNVTTCAAAGFPGTIQVGADGSASDPNVQGVVKTNAGTTQPGKGQEVDVTLLNGSVEVVAVVVKGGPAYNVYSNPAVLPPALGPDQHYISPINNGGNVPAVSHWFVCYNLTEPPDAGSLVVTKVVLPPDGTPVTPLPTSYTATVTCEEPSDAGAAFVATVTFGAGGGVGVVSPAGALDELDIGTVCTVVEDTSALDPAVKVTYDPTGANTEGVEIPDSEVGVTVEITNDFADVDILAEVVTPVAPAPVAASPAFTG